MSTDPAAAPQPLLPLRTIPGTETGTDRAVPQPAPVPDASTEGGTGVLAPVGTPVPVSAAARAGTAIRYHVRELWLEPGRLLHVLWNGKPESMAEHFAYMKSGAWVPEEMDGSPAKALITAGLAFHLIVAWPLKAAAKSLDAAASRPLRFAFLAALVLILFLIFGIL